MYSYIGKILIIDLSRGKAESLPLAPDVARTWLGGGGLGAHFIYQLMPPKTPPLAAESVLGFISSALNGSGALLAGRYAVVCKSPLTNSWHQASTGGSFGAMLRQSGYDAVLISGASQKPVYVYIDEGKVEIRDAAHLWGQTVPETKAALAVATGRDVCYSLIGPSGEQRQRSACIINDSGSAAGRGGCGAVMGSKNLKALVLRGHQSVPLADQNAINKFNQSFMVDWQSTGGDFQPPHYACYACPIGCGFYTQTNNIASKEKPKSRTKQGTSLAFGSLFAEQDREAVRICNDLCDEYGLDTIAVAGSVSWLRQCAKDGLFTATELKGRRLSTDKETVLDLTRLTVTGQGIGAVLAEGAAYAAAHFGRGQQFLPQSAAPQRIAPAELAAWLAAAKNKTALSLEDGAGKIIKAALRDACGFCKFDALHLSIKTWLEYLNAATGWGMDARDFSLVGLRLSQIGYFFDIKQSGEESAAAALLASMLPVEEADQKRN